MGASLAAVGEGFAASLGHVLWVLMAWTGIILTACTAIVVLWILVATHGQRKEPLRIVITARAATRDAEVGDDTIAMLKGDGRG